MHLVLSISRAAFRLSLRCYPEKFRRRRGDEMAEVFAAQLEEESGRHGLAGGFRLSLTIVAEIFTAALGQQPQNPTVIAGALSLIGSFALCAVFLRAVSR